MKKAVVLMITLFFIASVSALILKNLDDTDVYIKQYNQKISKIQVLSLFSDTKREIKSLLKKAPSEYPLGGISQTVPVSDAQVKFSLKDYEKYDVNILGGSDVVKIDKFRDLFYKNELSNFSSFKDFYLRRGKSINNRRQLDEFLQDFSKEIYDRSIYKISSKIGFLPIERNSVLKENEKSKRNYEVFINVSYLDTFLRAYMILNSDGKEECFELSFK